MRATLVAACDLIDALSIEIRAAEHQIEALAEQTPVVARLRRQFELAEDARDVALHCFLRDD